jgi:hypothetical protein
MSDLRIVCRKIKRNILENYISQPVLYYNGLHNGTFVPWPQRGESNTVGVETPYWSSLGYDTV